MTDVGSFYTVGCSAICLALGLVATLVCAEEKEWLCMLISVVIIFVGVNGLIASTTMVYVPAESLAHNQTQTVFTTDRGTYTADGLYPDGTYLLNVDGKNVLAVWQAVDGENE